MFETTLISHLVVEWNTAKFIRYTKIKILESKQHDKLMSVPVCVEYLVKIMDGCHSCWWLHNSILWTGTTAVGGYIIVYYFVVC